MSNGNMRRRRKPTASLFAVLALAVAATTGLSASGLAAGGQWKERSRLVWDAKAHRLLREAFMAWDPHPELGLDFVWETDAGKATAPGIINGDGRLIWLAKGAASYDHEAIYSDYQGEIRNGRPEGSGRLRLKSGLAYDGDWRDGAMAGRGVLRLENGDEYSGVFVDGKLEGQGRYAAPDGTVFEGTFHAGERNGAGTLTLPDGRSFRSVWRDGVETERTPLGDPPIVVAQNEGVVVNAYIDTKSNDDFVAGDPDMSSYVYTATPGDDEVDIRLDSPEIMDLWKGDGTIHSDSVGLSSSLFEDPLQFAPVFLVIELSNDGNQTAEITSAYFDLAESTSDLEPYVTVFGPGEAQAFAPNFSLQNYGWGQVENARLTYAFGTEDGPVTDSLSLDIGTFDTYQELSVIDGMKALGVDTDALTGEFPCASQDEAVRCLGDIRDAGFLGSMADATYIRDPYLMTRVTGDLGYDWTDSSGATNHRVSPVSMDIPVAYIGEAAEFGAPGAVERGYPTVTLPLDQQNMRIPIPFTAELAPGEARRFALNFTAPKSSHHVFQFVFELADGTTPASPTIDLLYFIPRTAESN